MQPNLPSQSLRELLRLVVCPACKGMLVAVPDATAAVFLQCSACGNQYPMVDGIPVLLIDRARRAASSSD